MPQQLPPLNALRAFETAARLLSFSKAAAELHVTTAAVSHQIKALENYLGVQLFQRLNRGLTLTEAAQACLPKLKEGFTCLSEAVQQVRDFRAPEHLTVWMAPSFAAKWLVPRLHLFARSHPDIDMRIAANDSLIETHQPAQAVLDHLRKNDVDVAIAFGAGDYPGCHVDHLLEVSAVPLCSPRLLHGERRLRYPGDLRHHTLLHDDTDYPGRPTWKDWLKAAGVTGVDAQRGLHFNHVSLALEAAIDGHGVVLSMRPLAAADLAAGRLVTPFQLSLPLASAYYIVSPAAATVRPSITAFRAWLLAEAKADETGETPITAAGGV